MQIVKGALYGLGIRRKGQLSGLGRVVASAIGKADYPSVVSAQIHEHAMTVAKVPAKKFFSDGRTAVETMYWVSKWYGVDTPNTISDVYVIEAEALGAKMIYSDYSMPTIDFREPLIKTPEDLDTIKTPIEADWGRVPYVIDQSKWGAKITGGAPAVGFCSPFSLAVGIRSYSALIRDMRTRPEFAHKLFTWIVDDVLVPYLEMLKKETGAKSAMGADAWACYPNLSLDMIEEWVVPYVKRLKKACAKKGITAFAGAGAADYCEEDPEKFDIEIMKKCWSEALKVISGIDLNIGMPLMGMGRTQDWPLEAMREYRHKNKIPLFGVLPVVTNINARFIREGPPEKIIDYIKRLVDLFARDGRMLFMFVQIPAPTPPEYVHTAVAALKTFGRYPIAKNLDEIKFEKPVFEPFKQWLKKQ
jgi:uroporphyrinogen-III decarboxylase